MFVFVLRLHCLSGCKYTAARLLFPNLFSLLPKLFFVFLIWRGFQSAFFFVSLPGTRRFLVQFRMGRRAFFVASARRFFCCCRFLFWLHRDGVEGAKYGRGRLGALRVLNVCAARCVCACACAYACAYAPGRRCVRVCAYYGVVENTAIRGCRKHNSPMSVRSKTRL